MYRELVMNTQHTALYMGESMEEWRIHEDTHTHTATYMQKGWNSRSHMRTHPHTLLNMEGENECVEAMWRERMEEQRTHEDTHPLPHMEGEDGKVKDSC